MSTLFLRPFSALYGQLLDYRNCLYDRQIKPVFRPKQKSISVGNLTVGGTGKTPMIEFLVRKLLSGALPTKQLNQFPLQMATLSRGYGRRTTGFRLASPADTAHTIGDEPTQLYRKFGRQLVVAVAERRVKGLQQLSAQCPEVNLVLLDDAFQHRAVKPHLSILLSDYNRPFQHDHPFPEGRLRERRHGAKRADLIVVTKCPDNLSASEKQQIIDEITPYKVTETPVFFSTLCYGTPESFDNQIVGFNEKKTVVLVSGLANADLLENYVSQTFSLLRHHHFKDHYVYTRSDVDRMIQGLPPDAMLLTTEKDWVKIDPLLRAEERATLPLYYLPVAMRLLDDEAAFWEQIMGVVNPKNA
ncbi:MAG: tetraacyldisaccharide 4'-kinase [Rudanella sp.]|nr:tetraacyldisaccharide 4'-kinase [Rudanella sp.]